MMNQAHAKTSVLDPKPATLRARRIHSGVEGEVTADHGGRSRATGAGSSTVRVLCVEDHAVLVEGLRAQFAIEGAIEIVGQLSTAARLVEEVNRLRPDVVLLDIELPGPDAFEMAARLHQAHPRVRIVVLSAHIRDAYISAAYAAGVCAYFGKSDEIEDIVRGIHEVMQSKTGTFMLGPKVRVRCRPATPESNKSAESSDTSSDVFAFASGAPLTLLASLTAREAEILRLIGKGLSRTQIASQLSRSVKTVDGHQDRMMTKLGIASRADLMRFAIREGLAQA